MSSIAERFERINASLTENPEKATSIDAIFVFDFGEEAWTLNLKQGDVEERVIKGKADDATVTVSMSPETWDGIFDGSVNPMTGFMTNKIKVKGDVGRAMKLQSILALAK